MVILDLRVLGSVRSKQLLHLGIEFEQRDMAARTRSTLDRVFRCISGPSLIRLRNEDANGAYATCRQPLCDYAPHRAAHLILPFSSPDSGSYIENYGVFLALELLAVSYRAFPFSVVRERAPIRCLSLSAWEERY